LAPLCVPLEDYFEQCRSILQIISAENVRLIVDDLCGAYNDRRFVFLCGNGGSGATASHVSEDLAKGTLGEAELASDDVPRLRILSLTDCTPCILAWGNDAGFESVFVEQLKTYASPGDVLISFSGSGNSPNVLAATQWANDHGVATWGITGFDGGELKRLAKQTLHVPVDDMGLAESIHLLVFHWIVDAMRERLCGGSRAERFDVESVFEQTPRHAGVS
jgi:D-sedoheptulose 7-phosphate isomerase